MLSLNARYHELTRLNGRGTHLVSLIWDILCRYKVKCMPPPDWIFTRRHLNPLICPLLKKWVLIDHFPLCVLSSYHSRWKKPCFFLPYKSLKYLDSILFLLINWLPLFWAYTFLIITCQMQPMVPITQDCFQPLPLDFYNFINYVISPQVIKGNDFSRNFTIALHNSPSFEPWIKFFANSQIATQIIDFRHDNVLYLSASYCLGQDWEIRP